MGRPVLIRAGLSIEFVAEFVYFILLLMRPHLLNGILSLSILLLSIFASVLMYAGFKGNYITLSRSGVLGSILYMVGASLVLVCSLSMIHVMYALVIVGFSLLFLGDLSLSIYFWRVGSRLNDYRIKLGALVNALPIVTFAGSLLLAIFFNDSFDSG